MGDIRVSGQADRRNRVRRALRVAGCSPEEVDRLSAGIMAALDAPEPVRHEIRVDVDLVKPEQFARFMNRWIRRNGNGPEPGAAR